MTFAALPATIERLLTGRPGGIELPGLDGRARRVLLVLLDAFGRTFLQRHESHPFVRRLDAVVPISSQFPSTTTAHVTTICTGLPVGQHGLYEWNVYEPRLGRVITPLLSSHAGSLLPAETFAQRLASDGLTTAALLPSTIAGSAYSTAALAGAEVIGFDGIDDGARRAAALFAAPDGPDHVYLYWHEIDLIGHLAGPSSEAFDAAVTAALDALERSLRGGDGVVLVTADHGQVEVHPERVDYVDKLVPGLERLLAPAAPAGSARDLFLHTPRPDEVAGLLREALGERASVHLCADLVAEGAFGDVGPRLQERLADVCVLPAPGRMAWLRSHAGVEQHFLGHHGGRTDEEMGTYLAALTPSP